MLLGRSERDVLAVPVLPVPRSARSPEAPPLMVSAPSMPSTPPVRRSLIVAAVLVCLAGIAVGTFELSRSPSHPASAVTTLAPVVAAPPRTAPKVVHHRAQPSGPDLAHTAAVHLAAKLPVAIESAALLRSGSSMYVVGGMTHGGKPSAGEYRIDLTTGHVRRIGTFVEPLAGAGAAANAGALYVAGGWTGEKAGTAVLRWTPGASSTLVARLPVALRSAKAAFSGSTLYVWSGAKAFAVDVASGTVKSVANVPAAIASPQTNLDYLTTAERTSAAA